MRNSIVAMTVVLAAWTQSTSADMVYQVVPQTLSGGYALAGGTITTDMPPTAITAFEITVTGPDGFVFKNGPGASISFDGFVLTASDISFDDTSFAAFFHLTGSGVSPKVQHSLFWAPSTTVTYQTLVDNVLDINVVSANLGPSPVTIATAVPEPSACMFLSLIALAVGGCAAGKHLRRFWHDK